MASVEERVARGAAWLDEVRPGWRDAVVPSALDLADGCRCILGQVFGQASTIEQNGYGVGINLLREQLRHEGYFDAAIGHGFLARGDDDLALLEAEWYAVLGVPTKSREARAREAAPA